MTAYRLSNGPAAPVNEQALPFGAQLSNSSLREIVAAVPAPATSWEHLLLIFTGDQDAAASEALDWLARARRTQLKRLEVLVVISRNDGDIQTHLRNVSGIHTLLDASQELHRAFRVAPHHRHGGTAVIRRDGFVEFSTPTVLPADDLRQLVEKYEVWTIRYAAVKSHLADVIRLGGLLPPLTVQRLDSDRNVQLRPERVVSAAVVVFGSTCSSCGLADVLKDVEQFSVNLQRRTLWLMFVGLDATMLSDALRDYPSWRRRSFAVESTNVFGFSSDTRFLDLQRPLVVYTDDRARVERVGPLPVR